MKKKIVIPLTIKCCLLFSFQEVTSSVAMEREAFTRCMLDILNVMDLPIPVVSTDRHVSIKKLMKTDERFWHILISLIPGTSEKVFWRKLWKLLRRKVIIFFILLADLLSCVYALKYDFPEKTWGSKFQSHTISSQSVPKYSLNKN